MTKVVKLKKAENVQEMPVSEQKEQPKQDFRFIIVGGNDASVSSAILKVISEQENQITVFEMDNDEMKFIINSRAQKKAEETSVDYINNTENKKRIQDWCIKLSKDFIKNNFKKEIVESITKEVLDGKENVWMTKKELKKVSNLSWSQFEELFGTLKLFSVVHFNEDNENEFTLLIDRNQIIENNINEAMQMLKLTNGKFASILNVEHLNSEQKKKMKSIKTRISNILK